MAEFSLPDPWTPFDSLKTAATTASLTSWASGAPVGSNNAALYMPVWFPSDADLYEMSFMATNGTGNYDLGLYDSAYARLTSAGSTAMTAAGLKTHAFATDIAVVGGDLYYAGIAFSSSSAAAMVAIFTTAVHLVGAGFAQQAAAIPLPDPMVPATMGGNNFPLISFGVR